MPHSKSSLTIYNASKIKDAHGWFVDQAKSSFEQGINVIAVQCSIVFGSLD